MILYTEKAISAVSDFASNYQGSGTWTHTYFTKSYFKMPIKYLIPAEPILQLIREARPLLKLKQNVMCAGTAAAESLEAADESRAALGMAHRVYTLGLDALTGRQAATPQPVGLRVFETVDDTPRAFFDVSEDEQPRLLQMSASETQLNLFARGLTAALAAVGEDQQSSELRLFRVPALNFEALWISHEGRVKAEIRARICSSRCIP